MKYQRVTDEQSLQLCDQMPTWAKVLFDFLRYHQDEHGSKRLSVPFLAKHFGVHPSTMKRWLKYLREEGFLLETGGERYKDANGNWRQRAKRRIAIVLSQSAIARRILAMRDKRESRTPMGRIASPVTKSKYKYTLEHVVFMLKNVLEVDAIALQTAVFHLKKPT